MKDVNKQCGQIKRDIDSMFSNTNASKEETMKCLKILLEVIEERIELLSIDLNLTPYIDL